MAEGDRRVSFALDRRSRGWVSTYDRDQLHVLANTDVELAPTDAFIAEDAPTATYKDEQGAEEAGGIAARDYGEQQEEVEAAGKERRSTPAKPAAPISPFVSLAQSKSHKPPRHHKPRKVPVSSMMWLRIDFRGNARLIQVRPLLARRVTRCQWRMVGWDHGMRSGDACMQVDRQKLIHKLGVQARDLRLLDPHLSSAAPPAILDREKAIVSQHMGPPRARMRPHACACVHVPLRC